MFRSLSNRFSARRRSQPGDRPAAASKRAFSFRPWLEELESRVVPSTVPLHVVGNQLKDSSNKTVILRGVNVISLEWRADVDNGADNVLQAVQLAHQWQSNVIRLPVNEDFWFGFNEDSTTPLADDDGSAYRQFVDQVISTAAADDMYVVLDLHWSDMGVRGAYNGQHYMPDANSTVFWQNAAARYANNPAVLFDPYNEPALGLDQPTDADFAVWRDGGTISEPDPTNPNNTITYQSPGMQALINTIRATGADNIVVPEGLNWGSDLTGVLTGYGLTDPAGEIMYQSHLYPNKLATASVLNSVLTVGQQYPIYAGEWGDGGVVGQPDPNAEASNQSTLAFLDSHQYSWTAWAFSPDLGQGYDLITDWNTPPPRRTTAPSSRPTCRRRRRSPRLSPWSRRSPGPGCGVSRTRPAGRSSTTANASLVAVDANGDVAAEIAGAGVWRFEDATGWRS